MRKSKPLYRLCSICDEFHAKNACEPMLTFLNGRSRSSESTRLPPMWPGFPDSSSYVGCKSLLLVLVLALPEVFSRYSGFSSPQKPTFSNSNSIWIIVKHFLIMHEPLARDITQALPVLIDIKQKMQSHQLSDSLWSRVATDLFIVGGKNYLTSNRPNAKMADILIFVFLHSF